jgi:hypothetical protein
MASRYPLIVNSSAGQIQEVPASDHLLFDSAAGTITALTDAATVAIDFSDSNNFSLTLGGNRTLGNPSNVVAGQSGFIAVTQDGTGGRTLAYSSNWSFAAGSAPTLTVGVGKTDVLAYYARTTTDIVADVILDVS